MHCTCHPNDTTKARPWEPPHSTGHESHYRGVTFLEVIVVAILGIISLVVAFSVRAMTDQAEASACDADARELTTTADSYMAQEMLVSASQRRYP